MTTTPRLTIEARRQELLAAYAAFERRHMHLGNTKAGLVAAALAMTWASCDAHAFALTWVLLPLVGLLVLWVWHERVLVARRRTQRAIEHHERALARLDDRWAELPGSNGERFMDPAHPYAPDLDLFGKGSLFALVSQVRTREGEARLAQWLLEPAATTALEARREAVRELAPRLDLREDVAVLGPEIDAEVHLDALRRWSLDPARPARPNGLSLALLALLAAGVLTAMVGWFMGRLTLTPLAVLAILQVLLRWRYRELVKRISATAFETARELGVMAALLSRFERESFQSGRLRELGGALLESGRPSSREVARLGRHVDAFESRRNALFAPVLFLLSWDVFFASLIEGWRLRVGPRVVGWIDALSEFEALLSLSGYAWEHDEDVWPEDAASSGARSSGARSGAFLQIEGLRHALLPRGRAVANDVSMRGAIAGDGNAGAGAPALLIISGSNMSGKSTLMRATGLAVVLAQCGLPVPARRYRATPVHVGASIRVQDSLLEGASRFFAEIQRLKQIVDLTERQEEDAFGVLFLVDEILQGTNSHDRALGVEAVMRELVERGAIGMITTHDLALTKVTEPLGARASNVHFEDQWADGKMVFDYRLRPGVVQRSNALELMRAIGLRID